MKHKRLSIFLTLFILSICLLLPGCVALVLFFGGRAVEVIPPSEIYADEINLQYKYWAEVIDYWEDNVNNPNREESLDISAIKCHDWMKGIIEEWDVIDAPEGKLSEYHNWVRLAMDYDRQAYEIMSQYYSYNGDMDSKDYKKSHNLAVQLWVLKDNALIKAEEALN